MTEIICDSCKLATRVEMYFYDERIISHDSVIKDRIGYEALATGKAICPHCGVTINKQFKKYIKAEDIIKLAVGEQR